MSASSSQVSANKVITQHAGINGVLFEAGTTARTGNWVKIVVVSAANFSTLTITGQTGSAMTGVSFPALLPIEGNITAFTLASGSVLAYPGSL